MEGGGAHIRKGGRNNIQNTITTIPAIYIVIYQRKEALVEVIIDTTDGKDSSTGRMGPKTDKTQYRQSELSISIL